MPQADATMASALEAEYRGQLRLVLPDSPERKPLARRIETVIAAKEGYRVVMMVPRDLIANHDLVMRTLWESDLTKQGGKHAMNRAFDEAANAYYASKDAERRDFVEQGSRDMHDRCAWLSGRRVTTSDMAAGAETSDAETQHEGFTVRVRKGVHVGA